MGLEVNQLVVKSLVSDSDKKDESEKSQSSGGGCCSEGESGGAGESGEKLAGLTRQHAAIVSRLRER